MGFPMEQNQQLQFQASNPVGDAVLLYELVEGPIWERVLLNEHLQRLRLEMHKAREEIKTETSRHHLFFCTYPSP